MTFKSTTFFPTRLYADDTFELILRHVAPALLEVSLGIIFRNPLETNHPKKCIEKHQYAGTMLNTNENIISS